MLVRHNSHFSFLWSEISLNQGVDLQLLDTYVFRLKIRKLTCGGTWLQYQFWRRKSSLKAYENYKNNRTTKNSKIIKIARISRTFRTLWTSNSIITMKRHWNISIGLCLWSSESNFSSICHWHMDFAFDRLVNLDDRLVKFVICH